MVYTKTMILFFYGEDTYRLKQKLKDLKEKYISASLGDTNLKTLDGKSENADNIIRQVLAYPFLAKTRLVILENFLKEGKKEVQDKIGDFLPKVPETTVLVFTEDNMPDKRTSLFKKLNKPKVAQEFKPLDDGGVKSWIRAEVEYFNGEIEQLAVEKLFEFVGSDLWRLSNEIQKLVSYNQKISIDTVQLLVRPQTSSDIFALVDALANRNKKRSFSEYYRLIENSENELYVLSMIVYQYRNMLVVRDFVERGVNSQYELAKVSKLHPFVAGKTMNLVRNYTLIELKKIYEELLNFDIAVKTGKMESKVAMDVLVAKLTV